MKIPVQATGISVLPIYPFIWEKVAYEKPRVMNLREPMDFQF